MEYNKIGSILLLLTCIFVSLGIGQLIKKNKTLEGARFKSKPPRIKVKQLNKLTKTIGRGAKKLGNVTNKGLNLGKRALASVSRKQKKALQKRKDRLQKIKQLKPPYDTIREWTNASKLALEAENLAKRTRKDVDIIKSRSLRKAADDLYKTVIDSIRYAQKNAVESSMRGPANHIKNIKNSVTEILNSVDTDKNKLTKIMNNIVLANDPNNFEIIKRIKNTAKSTSIIDSEKLVNIRTLVS